MFKSGAVANQDGAGRGSDGEGLAAAPHEEPQSQQQLVASGRSRRVTMLKRAKKRIPP